MNYRQLTLFLALSIFAQKVFCMDTAASVIPKEALSREEKKHKTIEFLALNNSNDIVDRYLEKCLRCKEMEDRIIRLRETRQITGLGQSAQTWYNNELIEAEYSLKKHSKSICNQLKTNTYQEAWDLLISAAALQNETSKNSAAEIITQN